MEAKKLWRQYREGPADALNAQQKHELYELQRRASILWPYDSIGLAEAQVIIGRSLADSYDADAAVESL